MHPRPRERSGAARSLHVGSGPVVPGSQASRNPTRALPRSKSSERKRRAALLAWTWTVGFGSLAVGATPPLLDLPTVVECWSRTLRDGTMAVVDDDLVVADAKAVRLLDTASGAVLWETPIDAEDSYDCKITRVDRTVALLSGARLYLLDLDQGGLRSVVELPGNGTELAGPPLVATVVQDDGSDLLLAFDSDLGEIRAEQKLAGNTMALVVREGVAATLTVSDGDAAERLEGFDAATLRRLWQDDGLDAMPDFAAFQNRTYLQIATSTCGGDFAFRPIDFGDGSLGSPLPPREPTAITYSSLPWDLQVSSTDEASTGERSPQRLRRIDAKSGRAIWETEIPGTLRETARQGDSLFVASGPEGSRLVLTTIDWRNGAVRSQAFGLPASSRHMVLFGARLVVLDDEAVRAFDLHEIGPPERQAKPIDEQVARILLSKAGDESIFGRGEYLGRRLAELELLGAAACGAIEPIVPKLGSTSVAAAAAFAEKHRCAPLAGALAKLLSGPLETVSGAGWPAWKPPLAILHALSKLGTDVEVPLIAGLLRGADRTAELRRAAFLTLASIGSPRALEEVRSVLHQAAPAQSVFEPPPPDEFLAFVGRPNAEPSTNTGEDWKALELRRRGARSAVGEGPDGERWVVYPSAFLGGRDDLWLARYREDGTRIGRPMLTGLAGLEARDDESLSLLVEAGRVTVRGSSAGGPESVAVAEILDDADGDGITDLEERRMRIDPGLRDSDGDGIEDGKDPAPNARVQEPATDEQRRELALFDQLSRLGVEADPPGPLLVVVSSEALEWRGRRGPTITLNSTEVERFQSEAGLDGIGYLKMRPLDPASPDAAPGPGACRAERPGDAAYDVEYFRGGLNAIWYCAVLRHLDGLWVLTSLDVTGVS